MFINFLYHWQYRLGDSFQINTVIMKVGDNSRLVTEVEVRRLKVSDEITKKDQNSIIIKTIC